MIPISFTRTQERLNGAWRPRWERRPRRMPWWYWDTVGARGGAALDRRLAI